MSTPTPTDPTPAEPTPAPRKPKSGIAVVGESAVKAISDAMGKAQDEAAGNARRMGWFKSAGAAAILFYGFYLYQTDSMKLAREERLFSQEQAREDRRMFRDGLVQMHEDSNRKWQAINSNQATLAEAAKAIQALQQTTESMAKSMLGLQAVTSEVGEAVKDLRNDLRRGGLYKGRPAPGTPMPAVGPQPESRGGELLPMPKEVGG